MVCTGTEVPGQLGGGEHRLEAGALQLFVHGGQVRKPRQAHPRCLDREAARRRFPPEVANEQPSFRRAHQIPDPYRNRRRT